MAMDEITNQDVFRRLHQLGYMRNIDDENELPRHDFLLLDNSISKGILLVSSFLNRSFEDLTNIMRPFVIDIICAEFFDSKRDIGIQEDGSVSQAKDIKKIQEENLKVEYDTSSSTSYRDVDTPFDKMIKYLRETSYQALQPYRYHYPYYQWYSIRKYKEWEKEQEEKPTESSNLEEALYK